jgi:hypothetical protein
MQIYRTFLPNKKACCAIGPKNDKATNDMTANDKAA